MHPTSTPCLQDFMCSPRLPAEAIRSWPQTPDRTNVPPRIRPERGIRPARSRVFGGPWTYGSEPEGGATGEDKAWLDEALARVGAVVGGRRTYEAAEAWGGSNPWGLPFFIVTHRPEEQPEGDAFRFVDGVSEAIEAAREAAGDKDVHVMGGADVIRQSLEADLVDELTIIVAPVVLGCGKRLFEGFVKTIELEHIGVRQSPLATFLEYHVVH